MKEELLENDGLPPDQETEEESRLTTKGELVSPISPHSDSLREAALLFRKGDGQKQFKFFF